MKHWKQVFSTYAYDQDGTNPVDEPKLLTDNKPLYPMIRARVTHVNGQALGQGEPGVEGRRESRGAAGRGRRDLSRTGWPPLGEMSTRTGDTGAPQRT